MNEYLQGDMLDEISKQIIHLEPSGSLPEWWKELQSDGRPSKSDPKTLGTIIEKLLKSEIARRYNISITGSSAAGVDIPELQINTKATSDRQPQSSEPFRSAYDRVLGSEFDTIVMIYNGAEFVKPRSQVPLRIITSSFLDKTQVADEELCQVARDLQQLYRKGRIKKDVAERCVRAIVFSVKTSRLFKQFREILRIGDVDNLPTVLNALDQENVERGSYSDQNDALCTPEEWKKFLTAPLDGKVSVSFALQWRFQFRSLLGKARS